MKLLIYDWEAYLQADLYDICAKRGISYDRFRWEFRDKNHDDKFLKWFREHYNPGDYDALLSINYWPLLSEVCQAAGVKYLAWCYDAPLDVKKIEETLGNECNYVFCFDRGQALGYIREGFQTVYHLPLGVNTARLERITPDAPKCAKYRTDVAFVGQLYHRFYNPICNCMDDYTQGYLTALMKAQSSLYGQYLIEDALTPEWMERISRQWEENGPKDAPALGIKELSFEMACELTRRERVILLNLCGARWHTRLYSYESDEVLKNIECAGIVDYWTEMPWAFAGAKINLNSSLRAIRTGIPLRALDVMGAGGFLLSNYQEEFPDYFVPDEELVLYESVEDAVVKADYYLRHEDERAAIARRGRAKIFAYFSLEARLETILETAGVG